MAASSLPSRTLPIDQELGELEMSAGRTASVMASVSKAGCTPTARLISGVALVYRNCQSCCQSWSRRFKLMCPIQMEAACGNDADPVMTSAGGGRALTLLLRCWKAEEWRRR